MDTKEAVRSEWQKMLADKQGGQWSRVAEKLRGLASYRNAVTVFATPHESLFQARVNCLADGKNLLMPGPSLRDGFFLLTARSVPFKDLSAAVTYKGLKNHALRLKENSLSEHPVDMLLVDSLAVDPEGGRIGKGDGLFDLSCALLHELGGLRQNAAVLTFILEEQIAPESLPQDKWDIQMNFAVTPGGVRKFAAPTRKPQIFWDMLSMDRIKRIDPLWKLYRKGSEGARRQGVGEKM